MCVLVSVGRIVKNQKKLVGRRCDGWEAVVRCMSHSVHGGKDRNRTVCRRDGLRWWYKIRRLHPCDASTRRVVLGDLKKSCEAASRSQADLKAAG